MNLNEFNIKLIDNDGIKFFVDFFDFERSNLSTIVLHQDGFYFVSLADRYFITVSDGCVFLSKNLKLLAENLNLEIDGDAISFYKDFGFIYSPFTQYKSVFLCSPYLHFEINNNLLVSNNFYFDFSSHVNNPPPLKDSLENYFVGYANNKLNVTKNIGVLVSGGIDSSVLLACGNKFLLLDRAYMCKMSSLVNEESRASRQCNELSLDFDLIDLDKNLDDSADKFLAESGELISDPIAPVFIDIFEHISSLNKKDTHLIDGQGADSLFNGLPHDKLFDLWVKFKKVKFIFGWSKFLSMPKNKSSPLKRKIYRFIKVAKCLTENSFSISLARSLSETGDLPNGKVFERFLSDLDFINHNLGDWHKTLKYIFMFRILPSREMQKYLFCNKYDITMVLPFLDSYFIEQYFHLDCINNIVAGVYKFPLKSLVDEYWPGMFNGSQTSPFQVNYSLRHKSIKELSLCYFDID